MKSTEKPLVWLHSEVKTPPLSSDARIEAGYLLRRLQMGEKLSLLQSRPMPSIGPDCHELRVNDASKAWHIVHCIKPDAIVIVDVFEKKTQTTPKTIVENCKRRMRLYES